MTDANAPKPKNKLGLLNLLVIVLSIYVLGALTVDTVYVLPDQTSVLLNYIDNVICAFFFLEFCVRFYQAENKLIFMRWGWIDLISSIPMVDFLRAGRVLRLIRLLRLIRAFRSIHQLLHHIFQNKAQGAFTSVAILAILLIIFSAIGILQVEKDPNSNIKTAEDALWWAYVTITTVGYGDKYPVTTEGRLIAVVLMTGGVGLFGTFTAYVASWFVINPTSKEDDTGSKA
jgi:voltage-gated potassium channel